MTTLRQAEANRRNAGHSTGPRTETGKNISKCNALTHGMAGAGVVLPEDVKALARDRYERWAKDFGPATDYQRWLVERIALGAVLLDRGTDRVLAHEGEAWLRAHEGWDEDRGLDAEQLGRNLAKRPALVARQLERTPHGCDWLIGRWESLGRLLVKNGEWSATERSLALDLLGTPVELRGDTARLDGDLGELVRAEVERLESLKPRLGALDDRERLLAASGRVIPTDPELSIARRYEAKASRELRWAMAQYFRATLGVGLSSPALGFPAPELVAKEPAALAASPPTAEPSPAPPPRCEPEPEPEPEPVPAPAPVSEPFTINRPLGTAPLPIRATPTADRPAPARPARSTLFDPKPAPNRQERRAEKAKARRAS